MCYIHIIYILWLLCIFVLLFLDYYTSTILLLLLPQLLLLISTVVIINLLCCTQIDQIKDIIGTISIFGYLKRDYEYTCQHTLLIGFPDRLSWATMWIWHSHNIMQPNQWTASEIVIVKHSGVYRNIFWGGL